MLRYKRVKSILLLSITAVLLYGYWNASAIWLLVPCLLIFIGITAWGAFDLRLSYFTPVIYKNKGLSTKQMAITFDDGPTVYTEKILDTLRDYNAKATFFCIGNQLTAFPEVAKRIIREGHTLGNHSQTHTKKMGFLSYKEVATEIEVCNKTIYSHLELQPLLYRPPFGVSNPQIAKAIADHQMKCIGWSIRSLDTLNLTKEQVLKRIIPKLESGSIILLHDTSDKTLQIVLDLLQHLQKQQWEVVNLETLLMIKAYED